jgi:hypothetical protein
MKKRQSPLSGGTPPAVRLRQKYFSSEPSRHFSLVSSIQGAAEILTAPVNPVASTSAPYWHDIRRPPAGRRKCRPHSSSDFPPFGFALLLHAFFSAANEVAWLHLSRAAGAI